ncbi:hypothetical protein MNBD_GAMMA01-2203 [hydrothermal vent metagenome]|uniref:Fido domain-containing protein n=1 Tax=hydrothermal vent metagenome TaxID=652676 RepID=A0A3B0VYU1_9ZZZZ
MAEQTITGQLSASKIEGCPVFIPNNLKLFSSKLRLNDCEFCVSQNIDPIYTDTFKLYFYKFFAGDKSLVAGFADIAILDLYLWSEAKIASSVYVKEVVNSAKRFAKVQDALTAAKEYTKPLLLQQNKLLRPKDRVHGIRTTKMRAGNPNNNPYAFYCVPAEKIDALFADLLQFINSTEESTINKSLIGMMQFIFIHPFKDGNGRTSRALFIAMMQVQYGLEFCCVFMLFLKNINRRQYYVALHDYRNGDIKNLKQFYLKAITWVNKSIVVLQDLLTEYTNKVGKHNLENQQVYSQLVVKADENQKMDKTIFQLHSKKGKYHIYTNTALLNVLNQFDYYLRYELRKSHIENQSICQ